MATSESAPPSPSPIQVAVTNTVAAMFLAEIEATGSASIASSNRKRVREPVVARVKPVSTPRVQAHREKKAKEAEAKEAEDAAALAAAAPASAPVSGFLRTAAAAADARDNEIAELKAKVVELKAKLGKAPGPTMDKAQYDQLGKEQNDLMGSGGAGPSEKDGGAEVPGPGSYAGEEKVADDDDMMED